MAEVLDITLTRVGQTFPVGTVVGLYKGMAPNAGVPQPVGPPLATATVTAEETLTFPAVSVDQKTYWAAAKIGGVWRSIQSTQKAGEIPAVFAERGPKGDKGATGGTGAPGLNWRGPWSIGLLYAVNDAVTSGGASYRAIKEGSGNDPKTNPTYWELLAERGEVATIAEAVKTADQELAKNNIEPQEITQLGLAVSNSATEVWVVDYTLIVEAANSAEDIKLAFAAPAATVIYWATNLSNFEAITSNLPEAVKEVGSTLSQGLQAGKMMIRVRAVILCGGTAGNVGIKASQAESNAAALKILKGSCMTARRLHS